MHIRGVRGGLVVTGVLAVFLVGLLPPVAPPLAADEPLEEDEPLGEDEPLEGGDEPERPSAQHAEASLDALHEWLATTGFGQRASAMWVEKLAPRFERFTAEALRAAAAKSREPETPYVAHARRAHALRALAWHKALVGTSPRRFLRPSS